MDERFKPGDVVRVRNARNKLGVYEILTDMGDKYKTFVLKFIELPLIGSERFPDLRMHPKQFMKEAVKNPDLYSDCKLARVGLTLKWDRNILGKLPIAASQIVH